MTRIAIVLGSYNYGGVSRFVEELVTKLIKLGLEAFIIVRNIVKPPNPLIEPYIIELKASSIVDYWRKLCDVSKDFDVVNVQSVYEVGGACNTHKLIFTYHGIVPLRYTKPTELSGFLIGYLSLLLGKRKIYASIGISDYICNELLKWGFPNVLKIPVGINLDVFRKGRILKHLKEAAWPVLLDVGPVSRSQGTHLLLSSMPHVLKEFPEAKLVLVGHIAEVDLYYKAKQSKIRDRVIFTGFVPDTLLINLYHTADIVIEIPYWHGFGLPILEGMACGKPIITRNAYAMKEHIQHARCGAMIEKDDPREVVNAIHTIIQNYNEMRKNAFEYSRKFDINYIAQKYKRLFTELI
ncbi:MAG: glycosyltransferase family 4 protein [Candidatus Bathyarchaeia archaeon]